MKKILLALTLVYISVYTHAQSALQSSPPNSANFFVPKSNAKEPGRILVGCTLTPPPVTSSLTVNLIAWEPVLLSVKIMNDNSEMVANWQPSSVSANYKQVFDISNYRTGKYHVDIFNADGKKVSTVYFDKTTGVNQSGRQ